MEINGPIRIGVLDKNDGASRELHISFREAFRQLPLEAQGASFAAYVAELEQALVNPTTPEVDRPGIQLVQQICSELLPHVRAGEIALNEEFVVEIGLGAGLASLAAFTRHT